MTPKTHLLECSNCGLLYEVSPAIRPEDSKTSPCCEAEMTLPTLTNRQQARIQTNATPSPRNRIGLDPTSIAVPVGFLVALFLLFWFSGLTR